jgi:hypothetical protein
MNTKYFVMVAAMAVMLIGATAFATDSAFADGKKKYEMLVVMESCQCMYSVIIRHLRFKATITQ